MIELLQRIYNLIETSCTGTPGEFARRIRISERHLRDIIDEMKDMGAPINYSRRNETYYYTEPFEIDVSCNFRRLSDNEKRNTSGGYQLSFGLLNKHVALFFWFLLLFFFTAFFSP